MRQLLLLDDEAPVLAALVRAIRQQLHGEALLIDTFTDPFAALAHLQEHSVDVVVSDYRMPRMTGTDFLYAVRELYPDTIRMVLSASTDFNTVAGAIAQAQVFRYIAKPWTPEALQMALRDAFAEHDTRQDERRRADRQRALEGGVAPEEQARRALEAEDPALARVNWGPNGEVLL